MKLFKVLERARFEANDGLTVPRAPIDERDGYMHLSSEAQLAETLRLHFTPAPGAPPLELVVLEVSADALTPGTLRWEPSRGGALFPHVHGAVPLTAVIHINALSRSSGQG